MKLRAWKRGEYKSCSSVFRWYRRVVHHVHVLHGVGGIVERGKRIVLVVKHRVPRFASCYVVIHRSIGGVVHRGNRIVLINIGRIVSLIVALWQFAGRLPVLSKQVLKNCVARFTVYAVLPLLGDRAKFRNEKLDEHDDGVVYYSTWCKHPWVRHLCIVLCFAVALTFWWRCIYLTTSTIVQ